MAQLKADIISKYNGFIFDIDGTMIHSMKLHLKAWQKTFEANGKPMSLKEVGELTYGINPEIVKRAFGENISDAENEKIANEKEELFRSLFDPEEDVIKGFIHFIDELSKRDLPMVIGSAAPPENVDFFMKRLEIGHYFKGAVHEDDVTKGKPAPEVFIKAAGILNIPAGECVVFEDSPTGAEASAKAGCDTIVILSSKGKSDFKDIPNIVAYIKDYRALFID